MASSCGKEYCPDTSCMIRHPLNGGKRARCERIKNCQNSICPPFSGLGERGFVLYDTCLQQCHLNEDNPQYPAGFQDYKSYLCQLYTAEDIIEFYQVNPCGGDETQTTAYKNEQTRKELSGSNNGILLLLGGGLLIALMVLLFKKRGS